MLIYIYISHTKEQYCFKNQYLSIRDTEIKKQQTKKKLTKTNK